MQWTHKCHENKLHKRRAVQQKSQPDPKRACLHRSFETPETKSGERARIEKDINLKYSVEWKE